MNQEQKDKIEQVAQRKWEEDQATNPTPVNPHAYVYGFKAGAKTILENPGGWGLVEKRLVDAGIQLRIETVKACEETHLQNEKYRKALEKIESTEVSDLDKFRPERFWKIAKEALKQEDTACPKCGYPLFKHLGKTCCQGCDYVKKQ